MRERAWFARAIPIIVVVLVGIGPSAPVVSIWPGIDPEHCGIWEGGQHKHLGLRYRDLQPPAGLDGRGDDTACLQRSCFLLPQIVAPLCDTMRSPLATAFRCGTRPRHGFGHPPWPIRQRGMALGHGKATVMAASRGGPKPSEQLQVRDVGASVGVPVPLTVWDKLLQVWMSGSDQKNRYNKRNQRMSQRTPLMSITFPMQLSGQKPPQELIDSATERIAAKLQTIAPFRLALGMVDVVPGAEGGWSVVVETAESREFERLREQLLLLLPTDSGTSLFASPNETGYVARLELATFRTRNEAYAARERLTAVPSLTSDGDSTSNVTSGSNASSAFPLSGPARTGTQSAPAVLNADKYGEISWEVKTVVISQLTASGSGSDEGVGEYYNVVNLQGVDRESSIKEFEELFATLVPPPAGTRTGTKTRTRTKTRKAQVPDKDGMRVLRAVMGDLDADFNENKDLLEMARLLLKLESGVKRVENMTLDRIDMLTKRSAHAQREQAGQVSGGSPDIAARSGTDGSAQEVQGLRVVSRGQEGGGGGAGERIAKEQSSFMSIFELDDDDEEEEEEEEMGSGRRFLVREGDDEGLMPFSATPSSTQTLDEDGDAPEMVDGTYVSGGEDAGRGPFVELTRRVLGDLQEANVSGFGSGSLDMTKLRLSIRNYEGTGTGSLDGPGADPNAATNAAGLTGGARSPGSRGAAGRDGGGSSNRDGDGGGGGDSGNYATRGDRPARARRGGGEVRGVSGRGPVGAGVGGGVGGKSRFASRFGSKTVKRWPVVNGVGVEDVADDKDGVGGGKRRGEVRQGGTRSAARTGSGPAQTSLRQGVQILLVRHGQSTWNAQGRWQGQADMPLSSLGVWGG
jgi:hypothetical protein